MDLRNPVGKAAPPQTVPWIPWATSTGKPPELPTRYILVPSSGFESRFGTKIGSGIWIVTPTWPICTVGWTRGVGLAEPRATVGRGTGVTMGTGATFAPLRLK